jgi:hypothetical protein
MGDKGRTKKLGVPNSSKNLELRTGSLLPRLIHSIFIVLFLMFTVLVTACNVNSSLAPPSSLTSDGDNPPASKQDSGVIWYSENERVDTPGSERVDTPGSERVDTPGSERVDTPGSERVDTPGSERVDTPGSKKVGSTPSPGGAQTTRSEAPAASPATPSTGSVVQNPATNHVGPPWPGLGGNSTLWLGLTPRKGSSPSPDEASTTGPAESDAGPAVQHPATTHVARQPASGFKPHGSSSARPNPFPAQPRSTNHKH